MNSLTSRDYLSTERFWDLSGINYNEGIFAFKSDEDRLKYIEEMKIKYPNDLELIEKIANEI